MTEPILRYDEAQLTTALAGLSPGRQAAFAAACAERLLPVYRWFHRRTGQGDPAVLVAALAALWAVIEGEDRPPEHLDAYQEAVEELVPHEDESWVDESAYAENAVAAAAYAIRSWLTRTAQESAWAARQLYEVVDYRVTNREDLDLNSPDLRDLVDADPLVQRELARQRRDLDTLCGAPVEATSTVAGELRQRARRDGQTVFDFPLE